MTEEDLMNSLRTEFQVLELKRFQIVNNYVMGIVKISEIKEFKDLLFSFRDKLYAISVSDSNLIEFAKMMVQHYNTEVLEDENILEMAYDNVN